MATSYEGGAIGLPVCVAIGKGLAEYGFGDDHPFGPDRMDAFWSETVRQDLNLKVTLLDPQQADDEAILRFHKTEYLQRVKTLSELGQGFLDYGDTPAFSGVYAAAATVVGSVLKVADLLMAGRFVRGFVPIAGLHHARCDRAAGFCVFNDAGVLIETLRHQYKLRRIAYVDIDAHHGDGVFYAFESDADVIIADVHEDGSYLYPGSGFADETGSGDAKGTKLNIPMPPGADDADFEAVWPEVEAFIRAAQPEFIIFQCGADSIAGDPITHMRYSPAAHGNAAASLCRIAEEYCHGRIIGLGGGGYNRENLAAGWNAVLAAFVES